MENSNGLILSSQISRNWFAKCSISYVFGLLKDCFTQKSSAQKEEEKEMWAKSNDVCKERVVW